MKADTPAMLRGLRWVADHQPVGLFPVGATTATIRKRLEAFGLIERCDRGGFTPKPDAVGFVHFQVTDKGRQLLWENRA